MPDELASGMSADREKDYSIEFQPSSQRVRVEFNGVWVADSTRALKQEMSPAATSCRSARTFGTTSNGSGIWKADTEQWCKAS